MEENPGQDAPAGPAVAKVRAYKRIPTLTIPTIPPLASQSPSHSPTQNQTPIVPSGASTQLQLRATKRSNWEKMDAVLDTYGFANLGDFLSTLFYHHQRGEKDPRSTRHQAAVTRFLQGRTAFQMGHLIQMVYAHPQSRPKLKHPDQRAAAFSPRKPLTEIRYAQPCLSAWATRLVGDEAWRRIGRLATKSDDPESRTHIRATTNGRKPGAKVATWENIQFTMQGLVDQYSQEELIWYLTECMAAPRVKGVVVIRKRRPHPVIQVGAISSFIVSRNSYASGDLALPLGIWHFACKSHVDVKRVYSRFGSTIANSTCIKALHSMSDASMGDLQESVKAATARDEVEWGKILDNVQEYSPVYEHGLGRENQLKVGTACTAFRYIDCKPGAWDASDHIARVIKQERQTMTAENVFDNIDWSQNHNVTDLHFVRVLSEFSPHLHPLSTEISARFRTPPIAKHRLRVCKRVVQPLATNSEREVETGGMARALLDFDEQMGVEPEKSDNILSWVRGDGASHATIMRLKKYLAVTQDVYKSCRNIISTPETWHTKATDLNSCASNHYGPAASKDPSSLSRSSNAANMKRPTDLKKCDFYPTSRSMIMIWEARILDCWRLVLGVDSESDLLIHFDELAAHDCLPSLDDLLDQASILRERYASQAAYEQSLSREEYDQASARTKIPSGSPWTPMGVSQDNPGADESEPLIADDMPGLMDIPDDCLPPETEIPDDDDDTPAAQIPQPAKSKNTSKDEDEGPKIHKEAPGFDGDRVMSNAILFIMEFGWWIELNYAIPEGDIGRVMEILKIYIFTFAGTSNQNYMGYMLDLYALLQFECSPELKEALLNNWLMNIKGEIGKFLEGDLLQEHYNRWLEDMVKRRGGDFDDKFYRKTIAPNVQHFLQIKEDIESAFELKRRSKAHPEPHLRDETKLLLRMYKDEELHQFRSGRSMGHAAVNRFDRGYQRLEEGKMVEFLDRSAVYAEIVRDMEDIRHPTDAQGMDTDSDRGSPVPSSPSSRPSSAGSNSNPSPRPSSAGSNSNPSSASSRPSSARSLRSSASSASRAAADSVQEWDLVDRSDEDLVSGSDLTFTVDGETGRMNADWYEEEEFESMLERLCGAEEDEVDSECEDEAVDTEPDSEGEDESDDE